MRARPRRSRGSRRRPRCGRATASRDLDSIAEENLAPEDAEEEDPLHDTDEPRREIDSLQREARVLEAAEQDGDEHDRHRVVAGKCGNDDARVAEQLLLEAARVEQVVEVAGLAR